MKEHKPNTFIDNHSHEHAQADDVTCPVCGHHQADAGKNAKCDKCGYAPMPTHK